MFGDSAIDWSEAMDRAAEMEEARFAAYVESLAGVIGHADRAEPLRDYCTGLLMPCERKSVEPMAAMLSPSRVSGKHQSLLHFVGQGPWSDTAVLDAVRGLVLPTIVERGPIEAWIVDDTGFAKKGAHSVGVARQYCGRFGKTENCQIAVTLSVANQTASLPIAYRLYLPEEWANDAARRSKTHVPEDVRFKPKSDIALDQIRAALAAGVPQGVVLADPAYGCKTEFRAALTAAGLVYAVGVQSNVGVWPSGTGPLPAAAWTGRGRRPTLLRRDKDHRPVLAKQLAQSLPARAWGEVTWREGTNRPLASRFAAVRVRPSSRDVERSTPHAVEWLLIEWPEGEAEPTKYWLSTLPEDTPLDRLVEVVKLRWRIERDYEELKSELGLAHYEGRGWVGFHHHATLCIAAYGFLVRERAAIPPSTTGKLQSPNLSDRPRPRGSPATPRTPHPQLDRNDPPKAHRRPHRNSRQMSMLPRTPAQTTQPSKLVTQ
jgi:SRSO17 transposase